MKINLNLKKQMLLVLLGFGATNSQKINSQNFELERGSTTTMGKPKRLPCQHRKYTYIGLAIYFLAMFWGCKRVQ